MPEIRTVIVDDEPPARRKLRALLASRPDLEVVGEAGDGLEAIAVIEATRPSLVLLDIRMPELDGFDVLRSLDLPRWPAVVFVTAYDDAAVRAFDIGAVDYVLKPVARDRLDRALDRAMARLATAADRSADSVRVAVEAAEREAPLARFVVRSLDKLRVIDASDVRWIEAAGNYVKLHTDLGVHLVRGTLQALEGRLDRGRFARIHRSTIVALAAVLHFAPAGHGDYTAVMASGERLTLSRRYRDRLPPLLFAG